MSQSSFVRRPALLRARGGTRRRIFPALLVLVAGAVAIGVYFVATAASSTSAAPKPLRALGRAKPAAATPTAREFAEAQVGLLRLPAGSNATTQKRSRLLRSREGTRQLLAAGFDGYLEKPIDIREFPDQIRRYCRPEDA